MKEHSTVRTKLIACEVMHRELSDLARRLGIALDMEVLDLGLHLNPQKLRDQLQASILNAGVEKYDRLLLAFGLCGGAARGLRTGDLPLVMPRSHDCVPILLGSHRRFNELRQAEAGTFYLTRGLLEGGSPIMGEYEAYCKKFGEKKARRLQNILYKNYTRLLYVKTAGAEDEAAAKRALESAEQLELRYEETDWEEDYLKDLLRGPWGDDLFITLPPHSTLAEEQFGL